MRLLIRRRPSLLALYCLVPALLSAQQKRMLTPQDYALWTDAPALVQGKSQVSKDGKWISYAITGKQGDSTFVGHVNTHVRYGFASHPVSAYEHYGQMGNPNFSDNSQWFATRKHDTLTVLTLGTGARQLFVGVEQFCFLPGSSRLLLYQCGPAGKLLTVHDLVRKTQHRIQGVKEYHMNEPGTMAVVVTANQGQEQVALLSLGTTIAQKILASGKPGSFSTFSWSGNGKAIAFYEMLAKDSLKTMRGIIYLSQNLSGTVRTMRLLPAESPLLAGKENTPLCRMEMSRDGTQVFFSAYQPPASIYVEPPAPPKGAADVRIWAANALKIPLQKELAGKPPDWYCWSDNGRLVQMNSPQFPSFFLTGDQKKALLYHDKDYLPQYKYVHRFVDMYIKDLASGEQRLVVAKVKDQPNEFQVSPAGKYIAYFKNKNWWIYHIAADTHHNITGTLGLSLEDDKHNNTGTLPPYGNPGWIKNDEGVLLYDRWDIWLLSADGSRHQKLTNGAETNTTFRIFTTGLGHEGIGNGNSWFDSTPYNGKKGILLTSIDNRTLANGLWWWTSEEGLQKIVQKDARVELASLPTRGQPLLYIESDFSMAPRLMLSHSDGKQERIYQTNPHQDEFYWGRSEVMHYSTVEGATYNGALLYPANYDSTKKYPLVVEIYEKLAKEVHRYIVPSLSTDQSNDVINPVDYTASGYFVLFPDIHYTRNNPGVSAAKCVIAAVQSLVDRGLIDKDRIGLTGHSFGGYETAFIITQTNLFRAAIAGAGITDLPNWYLSMSESFGSNISRVEEDQFRMDVPFYSDAYRQNSPMDNIEAVNTPVLLWSGEHDTNVDWRQTRDFHVGLWRLGKTSNMLVYPGEDHVLMKPENALDLSRRMKDWFNYYLKGEPPADWIVASQRR